MSFKNIRSQAVRATSLVLILTFVFAASSNSEARKRRRRHHRAKKRAVINEPDLYQRLGGSKVVGDLVNDWVSSALNDGRLSKAFGAASDGKPSAVTKLKKDLVTEVCELSDGPCKSADKKLPDSLSLKDETFVVFADHLVRAMDKMKIREREKNELLGRIGEVRADGPYDPGEFDEDETMDN